MLHPSSSDVACGAYARVPQLTRQTAGAAQAASHHRVRRDAGFGLIELVVTVAIFTLAILGLNSLAVSMIRGNLSARLNDEATLLAQEKFAAIRNAGYANTPPGTTLEMIFNGYHAPAVVFARETAVSAGLLPNVRSVSVTVGWTDGAVRRTTFATEIVQ
jgi:prepilin-type N-terminal cleavage/methylation domain-containing protein